MFDENNTPNPPSNGRPPTHGVYTTIEADGGCYDLKVGHIWAHKDSGDMFKMITVDGEFTIRPMRGEHKLH